MTGYFLFAEVIGKFPQLNIYRRFDDLTARTILYQQADLLHLEAEQRAIVNWEKQQTNEAGFDQSWLKIKDAPEGTAEEFQRQKAVEIQSKLKEYHETLLRVRRIHQISTPSKNALAFVRRWLQCPFRGDEFLNDCEADPWEPECEEDLVALCEEAPEDRLAQKLSRLGSIWHRVYGHRRRPTLDPECGLGTVWEYKHETFVWLANLLCVLISTVIPSASTFVLFYVNDMLYRLGLMACFIFVLAGVMMFILGSKRTEVFAATASFAAVQVVFLQGVNVARETS